MFGSAEKKIVSKLTAGAIKSMDRHKRTGLTVEGGCEARAPVQIVIESVGTGGTMNSGHC